MGSDPFHCDSCMVMICGCLALASFDFCTLLDAIWSTFLLLVRLICAKLEVRTESLACLECVYYMFVTLSINPSPCEARSEVSEITRGALG